MDALTAWSVALVESSDDAIIGKTVAGEITSWNGSAELIYGYTAAEAVGRHISMLAPPEDRDEFDELLAAIARGERVRHLETVGQRKDGGLIDVSVTISPIRDAAGRILGASTIARDIGERKRAERVRERALADLEEAQRIAKVGSWTWNPRAGEATWSAQMYAIFGRDPSEGPAAAEAFFAYVHPEDRARVSEGYARVFGGGLPCSSWITGSSPVAVSSVWCTRSVARIRRSPVAMSARCRR